MLTIGLDIWPTIPGEDAIGDTTPGGTANAFLQEDGVYGFLLEDGTSYLLMEA